MLPTRRARDLVVTKVGDDTIVFDERTNHLHSLPSAVSDVWFAANGARSTTEIATVTGLPLAQAEITLGLLASRHLLTSTANRRALLGRGGVLAGATIISIAAPTAAQAATGSDDVGDDSWDGSGDWWDGSEDWYDGDDEWGGDDFWEEDDGSSDSWEDESWSDNP